MLEFREVEACVSYGLCLTVLIWIGYSHCESCGNQNKLNDQFCVDLDFEEILDPLLKLGHRLSARL